MSSASEQRFQRTRDYRKIVSNKTIGHTPDGLAQLLSTLVKGKIKQIYGVITGHARAAPEGTWT